MAKKKRRRTSVHNRTPQTEPEIDISHYPKMWFDNLEILEILKQSPSTIKRRRRDGSLRASKKYGKIVFHARDIEAYLRSGYSKMIAGVVLLQYLPGIEMGIGC